MQLLQQIFATDASTVTIISFSLMIIFLSIFAFRKMQKILKLEEKSRQLKNNLDTMDEQARLIVKTDLELSQIQEELDRKISSLLALQNISQILSASLEEDKIFTNIKEEVIADLGFEFCTVFLKKNGELSCKVRVGLDDTDKLNQLKDKVQQEGFLKQLVKEKVVSQDYNVAAFSDLKKFLTQKLKLKSFIGRVIQTKDKVLGLIFLGNFSEGEAFSGAMQIVEILSAQIAQVLENIYLFERLYNSRKDLEDKIKERTTDLEKALEQIQRVNSLKSEFVSAVSHELRTPLTSVKGYAALLLQGKFGALTDATKLRLERINQQIDALVNMVNDLLDIARIESGRMKIEIQKVDLIDLAGRIEDLFLPQTKEKGLRLKLGLPEKDLIVEADKGLLERVLINLLGNAIKFTPEGKTISLQVSGDSSSVKVTVSDEGIGIPSDDLENVFKEFYRVETASVKDIQGTGLGLSLVRNIIKVHKGKIWVESTVGKGSSFIFTLPRKQKA